MIKIPGLVVILGSPNDDSGELSEMGKGRVSKGLEEYLAKRNSGWKLLLTGGFGEHFNMTDHPNAYYAKQILLENNVSAVDIVEFAESSDTVDDALKARPIVDKYSVDSLIVVSSDFHLNRVKFIFGEVFPDKNIAFSASPYLDNIGTEQQAILLNHEKKELESLINFRRSHLVGVDLDSWKLPDSDSLTQSKI
ncbi:hypothetical protein CWB96_16220 [Pseudoalteromonas citrea]|uniref:DUF218 domain-containing protein n=1 Tax=Pseudoalteromonas citrea TaxID=43655 RepID=A0A5S3XN00_9GAMM|nr:YdcF family protein [Pseudoalteromonas citrea]TMP44657.1 hypothetical protein CWB97_06345 [Pseudoalteromonas citrea]TMP55812.1 hypothetical protein CWB96_16220 [Pseudoalteromonas citrea]